MDGDDVGLAEQDVERNGSHRVLAVELRVVDDVVREDGGAEGAAQPRDGLADVTATDDADGRRGQLSSAAASPASLAQVRGERNEPAAERDHEGNRELSDRLAVHAWRPSHADAATPRRIEIDHVEAH